MHFGVIIQARMGSRRLPGKVLRTITGRPLLRYLLDRLDRCESIREYVVATSSRTTDNPIVAFCAQYGVACTRGSEQDVAGRFLHCASEFGFDSFVRLSADSPLLDMDILSRCARHFEENTCDLVTNIMPRTFPRGQSVEIMRTSSLARAYRLMQDDEDFEHVTRFFYTNPHLFRIENVASGENYGDIHFAVDTEDDLTRVAAIVSKMTKPHWRYGLDDVVCLYRLIASEAVAV